MKPGPEQLCGEMESMPVFALPPAADAMKKPHVKGLPKEVPSLLETEPRVRETILAALRMGCYLEQAAAMVGISRNTLYMWLRKGNEDDAKEVYRSFVDDVLKAQAIAEFRDLRVIDDAARQDPKWAAWKLERRAPGRWGRTERLEVAGDPSQPVVVRLEWPGGDKGDPEASLPAGSDEDVVEAELVQETG